MAEITQTPELAQIANLIAHWAIKGAKEVGPVHGRMCKGCAFKKGTPANNDSIVQAAAESVFCPGMTFWCHERPDQKCTGYLYASEMDGKGESDIYNEE